MIIHLILPIDYISLSLTFFLDEKSNKKINPSADGRFTRKTYAQPSLILPSVVKQGVFLRPPHLFLATLTVGSAHRTRSVAKLPCEH
jgi:hypothetical protein